MIRIQIARTMLIVRVRARLIRRIIVCCITISCITIHLVNVVVVVVLISGTVIVRVIRLIRFRIRFVLFLIVVHQKIALRIRYDLASEEHAF